MRFQCVELLYPEVFSSEQCLPYLFIGHVRITHCFNDDQLKVPVEIVSWFEEVFVHGNGVCSFGIASVGVYSPVHLLYLTFSDVLFIVAFAAMSQVDDVLAFTIHPVKYLESFVTALIGEELRRNYMSAAFCIRSAVARSTMPKS